MGCQCISWPGVATWHRSVKHHHLAGIKPLHWTANIAFAVCMYGKTEGVGYVTFALSTKSVAPSAATIA